MASGIGAITGVWAGPGDGDTGDECPRHHDGGGDDETTGRRGAASTSIPSSGWPTFTYSVAATHTIANDTSRCNPDDPPRESGEHRDAAENSLEKRRGGQDPRIDQQFATATGTGDREDDRGRGGDDDPHGDLAIAEFDGLMPPRHLIRRNRGSEES